MLVTRVESEGNHNPFRVHVERIAHERLIAQQPGNANDVISRFFLWSERFG